MSECGVELAGFAKPRADAGRQRRISFMFPYRYPSGVSRLFRIMAEFLARDGMTPVRLIDYADAGMAPERLANVQICEFSHDRELVIGENEVLVLQLCTPNRLYRQLRVHPKARLIFWQLHPYNLVPPLIPLLGWNRFIIGHDRLYRFLLRICLPGQYRTLQRFAGLVTEKGSLFFYDEPALRTTERYLALQIKAPVLLPVPVSSYVHRRRTGRLNKQGLNVAWIGRLYDFKIHILLHTLERFSECAAASHQPITFHVIGDGPEARRLARLEVAHQYFRVVRRGDIDPTSLMEYLASEVDLVAAMGTAALEGAAVGLPVILLDLTYGTVPENYGFRWLHETRGYDLGHYITNQDCCRAGGSVQEMLKVLNNQYDEVAEQCFSYCFNNHRLEVIGRRFRQLVKEGALEFGDLQGEMLRKSIVRRTYEWLYRV